MTWTSRPAASIFCFASRSKLPSTSGIATGLVWFSWSWIFVYTYHPATIAAAISRVASSQGQNERLRIGSSYS